uniref:Uncharacterized protein n=1 Tax=Polytomella parva TaxID=51329 RepID=A0A7S0VMV7_9CHLO|mmetsp:Transcript_6853/g.13478  ORF Transcript_6853/g.13478 Transcript_6853/m.13478 type:complete len:225 (+) Transcript_6853:2-676(+)
MDSTAIKIASTTVRINTTSNANQSKNIKDRKRGANSHIANNSNKSAGSQMRVNVHADKDACERSLGDDECRWIASHAVSLEVRGKGPVSSFPNGIATAATATATAAASNLAEEEEVKTLVQAYLHALPSLHRVDMAALEREWSQRRQQGRWRRTGGDFVAMPAGGEEGWRRREEGGVGEAAVEEEGKKDGREGEETDKNQKDNSEEERGWGKILGGKLASGSEL